MTLLGLVWPHNVIHSIPHLINSANKTSTVCSCKTQYTLVWSTSWFFSSICRWINPGLNVQRNNQCKRVFSKRLKLLTPKSTRQYVCSNVRCSCLMCKHIARKTTVKSRRYEYKVRTPPVCVVPLPIPVSRAQTYTLQSMNTNLYTGTDDVMAVTRLSNACWSSIRKLKCDSKCSNAAYNKFTLASLGSWYSACLSNVFKPISKRNIYSLVKWNAKKNMRNTNITPVLLELSWNEHCSVWLEVPSEATVRDDHIHGLSRHSTMCSWRMCVNRWS